MKIKIICIVTICTMLFSCEKTVNESSFCKDMHFSAVHPGSSTKASSEGFEAGDRIGVFVVEYIDSVTPAPLQIVGNWANNISANYDGSVWTTSSRIFWSNKALDVYAYYPYQSLNSVDNQPFSVAINQDSPGSGDILSGFEGSDLLWAQTLRVTAPADEGVASPIPLVFSHIMSKIVVNLIKGDDFEGEFPDDGILTIHNTVPSAEIDLARGVAVKNPFGTTESIQMHKLTNDSYEAIIVPQNLESRRPFLEYEANGVSFLIEETFRFKAGMLYTYNITINNSPDQISIEVGAGVSGWN